MADDPLLFARLDAALNAVLPPSSLSSDVTSYPVQSKLPGVVLRPASAAEVALTLKVASDEGAAVVPWGAGTHQSLGAAPSRYDVALDMSRLNRVIEYEPADLTVTVEAGMALSELQAVLAKNGQWLPLDPPLEAAATVGGVLATNASGPTRHRYGTARDLLIGITFALPNGELAKSGGRVVKNVAGYDLGKLQIGALGTLGVITQATFKIAPLPIYTEQAAAQGSIAALMSIIGSLSESLLAVGALELVYAGGQVWRLDVTFAGGRSAVERSRRDFDAMVAKAGAMPLTTTGETPEAEAAWVSANLHVRATVQPSATASVCEAFVTRGAQVRCYPTTGVVRAAFATNLSIDRIEAVTYLRRVCVEQGKGALVIEKAPEELWRAAGVWGEARGDFDLMRRIKTELDPNSTLNPGRYLGGI